MSGEPFRILLIEDNAADVYLFKKALENAQLAFELTVIGDGAEALAFVQRQGKYAKSPVPHLAVVDLSLPKHDGAEVLEAMRQSEHLAHVPVVITSSSAALRDRARMERLGIERYISKPPDLEGFLTIGAILKQILLDNVNRPAAGGTPSELMR